MYGKWMWFVILELAMLTHSSRPGRFYHDYHSSPDKNPWSGDWQQDWFQTTPRPTRRKTTSTTTARIVTQSFERFLSAILRSSTSGQFYHDYHSSHDKNPWSGGWGQGWQNYWLQTSPKPTRRKTTTVRLVTQSTTTTPPQPIIRDVEIRLGEMTTQATNSPTSSPRPITFIQDEQTPVKDYKPQIISDSNRNNFQSVAEDSAIKPVQTGTDITNKDGKPVFTANNPNSFGIAVINEQDTKNDAKPQDNIGTDDFAPISTIESDSKPVQADGSQKPADYSFGLAEVNDGTSNEKNNNPYVDESSSMWHVGIYKQKEEPSEDYNYICGGTLIRADIVISAAHCFLSAGQPLPTALFSVATDKTYPAYEYALDPLAQYAKIQNITMTGLVEPHKHLDLAIVYLMRPFILGSLNRPVCLRLDRKLEAQQLVEGSVGTIASWSAVVRGKCILRRHRWLHLPFVSNNVCQPEVHRKAIESQGSQPYPPGSDRFCAGTVNSTNVCGTDSGNGIIFFEDSIPYLRGVATNLPVPFSTRVFTNIVDHTGALKDFWKNLTSVYDVEECENMYRRDHDDQIGDVEPDPPKEDKQVYTAQGIGSRPVLELAGTSAPSLQWHVGVYSKRWDPYMQICGGSLVTRDCVISAAHCFWDDVNGQQGASQFAVAGGKLFRPWNDTQDTYAQHSDVSEIILPVRFRGGTTSFQDDIAILRLSTPFTYAPGVQSVCVDFNREFEMEQLQPGNIGTILGWGLTEANGTPSQRLTYLELPYVAVDECFAESEPSFQKFITSDKICAGDTVTGKALCRGDSGGGFILYSLGIPHLHGVASTAAGNENLCNAFALAAFTSLYSHRAFLRDNVPGIEKECVKPETTTEAQRVNIDRGVTGDVGSVDTDRVGTVGTTGTPPVYTNVPYFPYPNHFVCNCNCKP
ncbi:uncharacterized protein LOC125239999 isoform X2 [Leguminivora glycinivorella]|uniref:uncharacterized protein LOC125239999 isoform X2 n=1 Tax=Leguminivora glycinivorella TaxID=1035111 RepID=UPI00200FE418|nr:uncharacterized protein LOC125239999 isoform X2 [Leguminivora glycinivorella]